MGISQMFFVAAFGIPGAVFLFIATAFTLFVLGLDTPTAKERASFIKPATSCYFCGCTLIGIALLIAEPAT
jgi:hypothetical protein